MNRSTHIAIVGAGALGQSLAHVLREKKSVQCVLYDKDVSKVSDQGSLEETVSGASVVFFCIPSWAVREALSQVRSFLKEGTLVVIFAKGMEEETSKTMDAVCEEILPACLLWALMSGPMLAEELRQGFSGRGVVASKDRRPLSALRKVFRGTRLSLEYSADVRGVALAGVLKNVYAVGIGIADGLRLGGNAKGILISRAVQEMMALLGKLGGKRKTGLGAAGIGDLVATSFSSYSRNRAVGEDFVKTGKCCLTSEGSRSLSILSGLLKKEGITPPAFFRVLEEAAHGGDLQMLFERFLAS